MFISKCISLLIVMSLSVNSAVPLTFPIQNNISSDTEIVVEEIIDVPEVEIEEESVSEPEPIIEEVVEPVAKSESTELSLSETDINLVALVTMAEAEGESELGKRLVIDVILNQVDSPRFANTVSGVVYARNAFECMWNGRIDRCYVREDIKQLVIEELQSRTNSTVYYFRANRFHSFGTPVVQEGNHYFSTN